MMVDIVDNEYLICEAHKYYSYKSDDTCVRCEIESLRQQLAERDLQIKDYREALQQLAKSNDDGFCYQFVASEALNKTYGV